MFVYPDRDKGTRSLIRCWKEDLSLDQYTRARVKGGMKGELEHLLIPIISALAQNMHAIADMRKCSFTLSNKLYS